METIKELNERHNILKRLIQVKTVTGLEFRRLKKQLRIIERKVLQIMPYKND